MRRAWIHGFATLILAGLFVSLSLAGPDVSKKRPLPSSHDPDVFVIQVTIQEKPKSVAPPKQEGVIPTPAFPSPAAPAVVPLPIPTEVPRQEPPILPTSLEPPLATLPPIAAVEVSRKPRHEAAGEVSSNCQHEESHAFQFFGGGGVYYVRPHYHSNPAFAVNTISVAGITTTDSTRLVEFDSAYRASPFGWLGVTVPGGLTLRGRVWYHDEASPPVVLENPVDANPAISRTVSSARPLGLGIASFSGPAFSEVLVAESDLNLAAYDLELAGEVRPGNWSVLFSGGARYGRVAQGYNGFRNRTPVGPANSISEVLLSRHTLNGIGPTVAVEARRPLGSSGLSLFGGSRGAILFGTQQEAASLTTTVVSPTGVVIARTLSDRFAQRERQLPILEIEAGLEYTLSFRRFQVVLQAAAVSQTWFGTGNAANNETITGTSFADESVDNNSNLGLFGVRGTVGIIF